MSLLTHRSITPRVGTDERGDRRPVHAGHVRVVPPQAEDGQPTQVLDQGGGTDTIEQLLLATANGDRDALAALERYIGGLVRLNIRRVLRDASRSDAVTREFFDEVLRDPTGFDPDQDSAQSWLLTRAHVNAMSALASSHAGSVQHVPSSAAPVT